MKKHLLKPLLALVLVLVCGNVWGETYTELFTITSDYVVTNSAYGSYEGNDDYASWIVTHGGNNYSIGTNSSKRSNCTLKNYTKYAVPPVTTSDIASAFVSTTEISDVSKISYTYEGGKNQAYTNVYLIYSDDGNTFSQISLTSGVQGAAISSGTAFEFTKCSGYFGLLFKATNTSSDWRIDVVNVTFHKEAESDVPVDPVDPTITATNMSCGVGENFDVSQMFSSNSDGAITYSVEAANAEEYDLNGSEFSSEVAGTYTIKASQAAVDDKYNAGEATAKLTVIGTYTLHIIQPELGGTLTVKDDETLLTDGCKVTVGTKLTCEVKDIPEGKRFSRFYVNYDNDGEKYKQTNPATFDNLPTEGITEVTVTVSYKDLAKNTATFVSNNEVWSKVDLWEDEGLVFPDDPEMDGYAFMGWTTSSTVNADGLGIVYAKEGDLIQSNTTFYAVFAVQEGSGEASEKLTTGEITDLEKLEYATAKDFTDGIVDYLFYAFKQSASNPWLQIKKDEGSYVKISVPFTITKVELTITSASNSSGGANDISKHNEFTGTVALTKEDCTFTTSSPYIASVPSEKLADKVATLIPSEIVSEVYVKVSAGARIWGINVTYSNVLYSEYTTFCSKAYAVTIASSGYSTLYLDYAAEVPEGVTAYYATEYDAANDQVVLSEVSGNVIAANHGVILKGTAGTEYSFVETASVTAPTANLLLGTVASEGISGLSGEKGDYILTNGAFAPVSGGTLAAHKAYLHVEGRNTNNTSNSIGIRFDGATMIENVTVVEDNAFFDIQGRKVENPTNGLYIVNGIKVVVK